ncbi:MAG TPA: hypothetical protein VH331_15735 [Allosphingosinicella sp.]|jgi:hypothetical protein|nr:hypothetical protein [Allosphingosinicella sp.]
MHMLRLSAVLCLPLLAGGCLMLPVVEEHVYSTCHAISSSGWTAHVERIPDHHNRPILQPTLIVSGRVTVPSEGYSVSLDLGPVRKLDPPVQQILVRTEPPAGPAAQAPTTVDVRGAFPALKRYGAVTIRCGDGILAIIKPVPRTN